MKKIDTFLKNYIDHLSDELLKVNSNNLNLAADKILKKIRTKSTIFVCGNGGSAAIANHYICDF